jgi:hypothetical protein
VLVRILLLTASDSVTFRRSRLEKAVGWLQPGQSHSKEMTADGKKDFQKYSSLPDPDGIVPRKEFYHGSVPASGRNRI